ncbi:zinc finger protein 48-like [Sciurus carolinensis]|uniref:zinc finger protein 48-like n=1 Tax=Sciurus carolinensis TaxID=30640 RepID=UPI001FB503A8|nr:zinc finger protein 48-like [Sciurus carolinensis]
MRCCPFRSPAEPVLTGRSWSTLLSTHRESTLSTSGDCAGGERPIHVRGVGWTPPRWPSRLAHLPEKPRATFPEGGSGEAGRGGADWTVQGRPGKDQFAANHGDGAPAAKGAPQSRRLLRRRGPRGRTGDRVGRGETRWRQWPRCGQCGLWFRLGRRPRGPADPRPGGSGQRTQALGLSRALGPEGHGGRASLEVRAGSPAPGPRRLPLSRTRGRTAATSPSLRRPRGAFNRLRSRRGGSAGRPSARAPTVLHRGAHTGHRPDACPHCGGFRDRRSPARHERTHTGQSPWACGQCGRAFSQTSTPVTHRRTHASGGPTGRPTAGRLSTPAAAWRAFNWAPGSWRPPCPPQRASPPLRRQHSRRRRRGGDRGQGARLTQSAQVRGLCLSGLGPRHPGWERPME